MPARSVASVEDLCQCRWLARQEFRSVCRTEMQRRLEGFNFKVAAHVDRWRAAIRRKNLGIKNFWRLKREHFFKDLSVCLKDFCEVLFLMEFVGYFLKMNILKISIEFPFY